MDLVNFLAGREEIWRGVRLIHRRSGLVKGELVLRSLFTLMVLAGVVQAEEFSIVIGSPVAAQSSLAKRALMAVRTKGCEDVSKVTIGGKAEGLVKGERRSIPLSKMAPMPTPGVYAVFPEWPAEGAWLLNVTAHCGGVSAFALIPVGPEGFSREASKFLNRPAEEPEIEAILKSRKESKP